MIYPDLCTCDLLEAPMLLTEIGFTNRVVDDAVSPEVVGVGPSNNANDGQVLTVRTSYGVDDAQLSCSERHHAYSNAVSAGVSVGSIAVVKLGCSSR
jgi:hypothetical protein